MKPPTNTTEMPRSRAIVRNAAGLVVHALRAGARRRITVILASMVAAG